MGIRGLYNDLWTVTASPFTVFYWRTQGIFERKRFTADPLAGPRERRRQRAEAMQAVGRAWMGQAQWR